jgi:hypothetical protein
MKTHNYKAKGEHQMRRAKMYCMGDVPEAKFEGQRCIIEEHHGALIDANHRAHDRGVTWRIG